MDHGQSHVAWLVAWLVLFHVWVRRIAFWLVRDGYLEILCFETFIFILSFLLLSECFLRVLNFTSGLSQKQAPDVHLPSCTLDPFRLFTCYKISI